MSESSLGIVCEVTIFILLFSHLIIELILVISLIRAFGGGDFKIEFK
jgi:hypothetical protein